MIRHRPAIALTVCHAAIALFVSGCSEFKGPEPPLDELYYPVGVTVHPDGRFLYVVNANFDVRYRSDIGGTVSVLDAFTLEHVPGTGVAIGSFGGGVVVNGGRDGESEPDRLYVAVRGDNSVVALAISDEGARVHCPNSDSYRALPCRLLGIPRDPFGIAMVRKPESVAAGVDVLAVASLGGQVSFVALDDFRVGDADVVSRNVSNGAAAIRYLPEIDQVWVAARFSTRVRGIRHVFDPTQPTSGRVAAFSVDSETLIPTSTDRAEARGLTLSSDGSVAYVTSNAPGAVTVIDMRSDGEGRPFGTVLNRFDVDGTPAELIAVRERGREVLYIALADAAAIGIFDGETGLPLGRIELSGLAFGVAHHAASERLYVTLFDEHAVAAIDLAPTSPTFRQVVGRTR